MRYQPYDSIDTVIGNAALDAVEADAKRFTDDADLASIGEHVAAFVPVLVEEIRMYRRWRSQVRTNVIAALGPANEPGDT